MSDRYKWGDPHPGLMGCTVPLPKKLQALAKTFDGKSRMSKTVLAKVKLCLENGFTASVHGEGKEVSIMVRYGSFETGGPVHCWRLIKGRQVSKHKASK